MVWQGKLNVYDAALWSVCKTKAAMDVCALMPTNLDWLTRRINTLHPSLLYGVVCCSSSMSVNDMSHVNDRVDCVTPMT